LRRPPKAPLPGGHKTCPGCRPAGIGLAIVDRLLMGGRRCRPAQHWLTPLRDCRTPGGDGPIGLRSPPLAVHCAAATWRIRLEVGTPIPCARSKSRSVVQRSIPGRHARRKVAVGSYKPGFGRFRRRDNIPRHRPRVLSAAARRTAASNRRLRKNSTDVRGFLTLKLALNVK
jgi:hypothetical protein